MVNIPERKYKIPFEVKREAQVGMCLISFGYKSNSSSEDLIQGYNLINDAYILESDVQKLMKWYKKNYYIHRDNYVEWKIQFLNDPPPVPQYDNGFWSSSVLWHLHGGDSGMRFVHNIVCTKNKNLLTF